MSTGPEERSLRGQHNQLQQLPGVVNPLILIHSCGNHASIGDDRALTATESPIHFASGKGRRELNLASLSRSMVSASPTLQLVS